MTEPWKPTTNIALTIGGIVFQLDARELNHHTAIRLLLDLFDRGLNVDAVSFRERWHIKGIRRTPC